MTSYSIEHEYTAAEEALRELRWERRNFTDELNAMKWRRYRPAKELGLNITALTSVLKSRYDGRMLRQDYRQSLTVTELTAYEYRRECIFGKKARSRDKLVDAVGHHGEWRAPFLFESPAWALIKNAAL